jgi:hypothetical protein
MSLFTSITCFMTLIVGGQRKGELIKENMNFHSKLLYQLIFQVRVRVRVIVRGGQKKGELMKENMNFYSKLLFPSIYRVRFREAKLTNPTLTLTLTPSEKLG